jgi:hypothetical protein
VVIALVTSREAPDHDKDLQPVYDALIARGVEVEIHNWDDAAVNWKRFAAAIVRSPWDYHRRFDEFMHWLRHVSQCTTLHNPADVIAWNLDKAYLTECVAAEIETIPTLFVYSEDDLVDEVHERQQQTDVLLIILRTLLDTTRPDLKVILMSATLDSDMFCSYFNGAPLISVPGKMFPVKNYFLEDLIEATGHVIEEGSVYAYLGSRYTDQTSLWVTTRGGDKRREVVDLTSSNGPVELSSMFSSYSMNTRRSMERVNEKVMNFDLIEDVLTLLLVGDQSSHALNADGVDLSTGNILIFLPGIGEIKTMTERLEGSRTLNRSRFAIIPMHSTLSSRDQRRAFVQTKLRKISK